MLKKDAPQNRPRSPKHAPDPATTYERAKEEKKPQLTVHDGREPDADPSDMNTGASNVHVGDRQINAQDDPADTGASAQPLNQIKLSKGRKGK